MKKILLDYRTILLLSLLAISLIFISCRKDDSTVNPTDNHATQYGNITGKVVTTGGTAIMDIAVSVGNITTYTDQKGGFFLSNVPIGERILVNFKNDSYASTQRIVKVVANHTSDLDAAMLTVGKKTTLNAATGGSIAFNGANVTIPASAIVDSHGNPFSGSMQVNTTYCDPSNDAFLGAFPGEFKGTRTDNSETQIESYGFINVELWNGTEKLQIASGKQASITLPITAKLQSKAPATIPLWYYDEIKGQWIEEGTATKTGNTYVGSVKHFSNWNCDMPTITSYLSGKVVDAAGNPISCATVTTAGVDYTGRSSALTADDGSFKLGVKSNSTAAVTAKYHNFASATNNYTTAATGVIQDIGTITIAVDTANVVIIVGRMVDNGNLPVPYVYLKLVDTLGHVVDQISTSLDGKFKLWGEINNKYSIEVQTSNYDTSSAKATFEVITGSQYETKDMGDLKLDIGGSTIIGRCVDSLNNPLKNVYVYATEFSPNTKRENSTDSTGRFSLWVRPNITFKTTFYFMQKSKAMDVTSGALGDTKDIGDIILP